jgi:hypothetical protein
MPSSEHSKLFSSASRLAYDIKKLYEDLKAAEALTKSQAITIANLEAEIISKSEEIERLSNIITDQSDKFGQCSCKHQAGCLFHEDEDLHIKLADEEEATQ